MKALGIGIGVAIGLVFWPVLLPVVVVLGLLALLRCGVWPRQKPAPPAGQSESTAPSAVLDPMVRAQALAQVARINTEVHRDQLERSIRQAP